MPAPWLRVMTCDECREFDRRASRDLGIPSILLMENAAKNATDVAVAFLEERHGTTEHALVLIVCGTGNNGGDGYAMARHLAIAGVPSRILALAPIASLKGDAAIQASIASAMGIAIDPVEGGVGGDAVEDVGGVGGDAVEDVGGVGGALRRAMKPRPTLIIDALFGTGLSRPLDGVAADLVLAMNATNVPIMALDVPSGLNADTGEAIGVAVHATATVAMAALKPGLLKLEAQRYVGDLSVVDIGVPSGFAQDLGTMLNAQDTADNPHNADPDEEDDDDFDIGPDTERSRERL